MPIDGVMLKMLGKITTRQPKPSDNPEEISCVSLEEFTDLVGNRGMIAYERHGHQYALLMPPSSDANVSASYIQAVPTKIGQALREQYPLIQLCSFRLHASEEVLSLRLTGRNDAVSKAEMESRFKTIKSPVPEGVDYLIDASGVPKAVASSIAAIIKQRAQPN